MIMRENQKGFIAITSVLIINALILVLGISMFHVSLMDQSMSASYDDGEEASLLAQACLREAFSRLEGNIGYAGGETINIGGMNCSVNPVYDINDHTKKISTFAMVGDRSHLKRAEKEIEYITEAKAEQWICEDCAIDNLKVVENSLALAEKFELGEERVSATRTTETTAEWTGEGNYYSLINLRSDGDGLALEENQYSGYRISKPLYLGNIKYVGASNIEWIFTLATDTEVNLYTEIVESEEEPESPPENWQSAINGQQIPEIEEGMNMANRWLWVKQELKTTDLSFVPSLHSLTEQVTEIELIPVATEGSRVSSEIDISGQGKVEDSQIFWQADTLNISPIVIETRLYNGTVWTNWERATSGREIPGLIKGADLQAAKIQTRALFSGGPELYPSLKNLNIFIGISKPE